MFKSITQLLKKLVDLAQERNNLALESLSELRDIHKLLIESEMDGDALLREQRKQTKLLTEIANELVEPAPGLLKRTVMIFGSVGQI